MGLLALTSCGPSGPTETHGERAARACAEQFGKGSPADADCQLQMALTDVERDHETRISEAQRRAGE